MSRANVSAQLAGSSLDRYMAMITTVSEVSQKTPETVGESFKTLYSRFQKIAATKFEVSQEEAESEGLSAEDFSNLNEIEQVLKAVGISVRDSVDSFRNVDDIIDDISDKWLTFTDVQKSGIATAVAGTRQRENFLILMENMDLVAKYEKIAAEASGTAAKKMEAYTSGVEAAQKRLTASLEKWALMLNNSDALQFFYNTLATVADNLVAFGAALIAAAAIVGKGSLMAGAVGGAGKVVSFLGNVGQVFSGGGNQEADRQYAKSAWQRMWSDASAGMDNVAAEIYSSSLTRAAAALDEEEKATLKVIQTSMLAQDSTQRKKIAEELQTGAITEATTSLLTDAQVSILLKNMKQEDLEALQKEYFAVKELTDRTNQLDKERAKSVQAENEYNELLKDANRYAAGKVLSGDKRGDSRYSRSTGRIRGNLDDSTKRTPQGMVASGIGSIFGMTAGATVGSNVGGLLGGDIGSTIGGTLGSMATASMFSKVGQNLGDAIAQKALWSLKGGIQNALPALGANLSTIFARVNPAAIIALFVAGVTTVINAQIKKYKEELINTYNEVSEKYSTALSASANTVEYDKLAKGVDYLGRNVSLTSEEYQTFLDLSNKLAESFPELVVRTDEYGNKLIGPDGLEGKVGQVTDAVDGLVESLKNASTVQFFDDGDHGFTSWINGILHNGADVSAFGQQWQTVSDSVEKAENKLTPINSQIEYYKAQANQYQGSEEDYEIELYEDAQKHLEELIPQQEAYEKAIQESKSTILEYTDALIDYASTTEGINDMGTGFSGLGGSIDSMDEDEQSFISAMTKLRGAELDFTNMDEYKKQILTISQEMTDMVKQNPAIVDVYYGVGEFETVGEQSDWKEKFKEQLIQALMDENGEISEDGKTLLISLGYKINPELKGVESVSVSTPVDQLIEAMGLDSSSTEETLSEEFTKAVNGMTQYQFKRAYNLASNGWMGENILNNPTAMMKMVNGEYYNGDDTIIRSREQERMYAKLDYDSEGHTAISRKARNLMLGLDQDEGGRLSKTDIAEQFSGYSEEVWNQIDSLQDTLANAGEIGSEEYNKALEEGLKNIDLSAAKDVIEYQSQTIANKLSSLFSDIDFGDDGIINTFSELKEALSSVNDIFDQLASARKEQKASGKLSLETTLDLLAANEDYVNALSFENDTITLKADAEETMARVRLLAVKASIQATIAEKENTLATLQNQYQQLATEGTYQDVADATVNATNVKIDALNKESEALINEANNLQYLTQMWAILNEVKAGGMTYDQASKKMSQVSFGTQKAQTYKQKAETTTITLAGEEREAKLNSLKAQIEELSGSSEYTINDDGTWTWETKSHIGDDGLIHYDEGDIATWQHLGGAIDKILDSGKLSQSTWKKGYTNPIKKAGKAAKDTTDDLLNLLKAYDSIIDKEWEAMKVFDEDNLVSTGYTKYFEKKRASLEKLASYYQGMMENDNLTEKKRLDAEKNYIENQKAINNLDDEEVEDKYKILELYGASIESLIDMKQQLLKTSDTYEEMLENQKALNELIQDEIDLRKQVGEWQQELADMQMEYVKGTAWTNESMYDTVMNASVEAIEKQIEATKESIEFNFNKAVEAYMKDGMTLAEAQAYVAQGNNEYSQNYRDAITALFQLQMDLQEVYFDKLKAQIDEIEREINTLESSAPKEWTNTKDIDSFYSEKIDLLQAKVDAYNNALKDLSKYTDDQINEIVDGLNDAVVAIQETKIQQQEDIIDVQEKQYDAIVYRINLYKDELQKAIDDIEDAYEKEVKPLEDINDEIERQIQLTDLLAAKKNAAKEKERVYREGIGWVNRLPLMDYIG